MAIDWLREMTRRTCSTAVMAAMSAFALSNDTASVGWPITQPKTVMTWLSIVAVAANR